jgi:hypothetical protein
MKSVQDLLARATEFRVQAASATNEVSVRALIALAEEFELQAAEIGEAQP